MSVEDGCGGYFIPANVGCDFLERELLVGFGFEEHCGGGGEVRMFGDLGGIRLITCSPVLSSKEDTLHRELRG